MAAIPLPTPAPAAPLLASALLDIELDRQRTASKTGLWQTGTLSLDCKLPRDLWTGGKVVGIVSVDGLEGGDLAAHLIASHLLSLRISSSSPEQESPPPSTFIITPPTFSTTLLTSIHSLLTTATTKSTTAEPTLPTKSTTTRTTDPASPLTLLNTVSLLQYLDFAGLVESLAEVSASLHTSTTTDTDTQPNPKILLLTGLTPTVLSLSRRSNSSACALLASLMRQLTHLSRTNPALLMLVDLDLEIVNHEGQGQGHAQLPSAFANLEGTQMQLSVGSGALGSTLERGLDVVVAAWKREGEGGNEREKERVVVEVVKDRVGTGFGVWGVVE